MKWSPAATASVACGALAVVLGIVLVWLLLPNNASSKSTTSNANANAGIVQVNETDALALLRGDAPCVVMVYKPRCRACETSKKQFEDAAKSQDVDVPFFMVDGELAPALRKEHNVTSYPTFLGLDAKKSVQRMPPSTPRVFSQFVAFARSLK